MSCLTRLQMVGHLHNCSATDWEGWKLGLSMNSRAGATWSTSSECGGTTTGERDAALEKHFTRLDLADIDSHCTWNVIVMFLFLHMKHENTVLLSVRMCVFFLLHIYGILQSCGLTNVTNLSDATSFEPPQVPGVNSEFGVLLKLFKGKCPGTQAFVCLCYF